MSRKNWFKRKKRSNLKHEKTITAIYGAVILTFGVWFLKGAPDVFMYVVGGFFVFLGLNIEYGVYKKYVAEKAKKSDTNK